MQFRTGTSKGRSQVKGGETYSNSRVLLASVPVVISTGSPGPAICEPNRFNIRRLSYTG